MVYSFAPSADVLINVDLCGSAYDTRLFVVDPQLDCIAYNDDYYYDEVCGHWVSYIENVPLAGGEVYYIIVDGYGGACGAYELNVSMVAPCELTCPPASLPEGEPPLADGQPNDFNGGCASTFQEVWGQGDGELVLCATGGWFTHEGGPYRDTDWYLATFGDGGVIEILGDAEYPLYLFELGPHDCAQVDVVQQRTLGPCAPQAMTVTGDPGATAWIWAGATVFTPPFGFVGHEFDYVLWWDGLQDGQVATEATTWSNLKALYQ